jgi:hypothetical protein
MAPVASADVMAITKWSIFRKRHGGLLRIRRERPSAERKCKQRHLRIKMKELMALGAGLPTIFQNREDVRPEGLRLPESTTARPR